MTAFALSCLVACHFNLLLTILGARIVFSLLFHCLIFVSSSRNDAVGRTFRFFLLINDGVAYLLLPLRLIFPMTPPVEVSLSPTPSVIPPSSSYFLFFNIQQPIDGGGDKDGKKKKTVNLLMNLYFLYLQYLNLALVWESKFSRFPPLDQRLFLVPCFSPLFFSF